MADKTLTASNATYVLAIRGLRTAQLQGFAADDVFDTEGIASAEVLMGVDGVMSSGFVYVPVKQGINLQADSDSNDLFDDWWAANQQAQDIFYADGVITLPALRRVYTLTKGVLTLWKPAPDVKKIIQPRKFEITWQTFSPSAQP